MNINFTLKCEACHEVTNCRVGMSNRDEQPLRFCCQDCGAPIDIVLGPKGRILKGAEEVAGVHPFDDTTNFVDLHLDFPVSFEKYVMGMTPFMRAHQRIGTEAMQRHNARLNFLNNEMVNASKFNVLLKHYQREKVTPFKMNMEHTFEIKLASERQEDVNAALYVLIAKMMAPFAIPGQDLESVEAFQEALFPKKNILREPIDKFIDEIIENKFLKNMQIDCLEIYPKILAAELPLRPALFLDFDHDYRNKPSPMRISTEQFESYKDLFKDISEIISRQLVLVAGINNIQKRGDHNAFLPITSKAGRPLHPSTLNEFADFDFGKKRENIDDCWFEFVDGTVDNHLRNSIAHYKAEYDDVTQLVTYFPKKEGMNQENNLQIYFLDFMHRLLLTYREMHRLHHTIKCLFYYRYLIQKKP